MDEPAKRPDLSPEQQNTTALIRQLLGKSLADRYVDFCRLASGAFPLRVSIPLAAHALRELESILRQTLAGPMEIGVGATPDDLKKIDAVRKHLHAVGFNEDTINRAAKELQPRLSHKADTGHRHASWTGGQRRHRAGLDCDFPSSCQSAWSRPLPVAGSRC
jgi:hypothetical protein